MMQIQSRPFTSERIPPRLTQVITMMAEGKSAKEIAFLMSIPVWKANAHISSAKEAAGVQRDTALVAVALRRGWIL